MTVVKQIVKDSDIDPNFKYELANILGETALLHCFQCGTCTSSCPVADDVDIKPHQVIGMTLLGLKGKLLQSKTLWLCAACLDCAENCPRGVRSFYLQSVLKNLAARANNLPEGIREEGEIILTTGLAIPISSGILKRRKKLGLPELTPPAADTFKKIAEVTGFASLISKKGEEEK
ncbi:MAG: 4Fe-4S dicluster domain-containing protein [Promethearchaeota archaeon]